LIAPLNTVDTRPGIDFVRYLICEAHQDRYDNRLNKVETAFLFKSQTQKAFENCIAGLAPNVEDLPLIFSTILRRIVISIFATPEGEVIRQKMEGLLPFLYINDRSMVSKSYNRTVRQRLTAAGKKLVAAKKTPTVRHYEPYQAVVKPHIETIKKPLNANELVFVKNINAQLQSLEAHVVLPKVLDQAKRHRASVDIIKLYHVKCSEIDRIVNARAQTIHKHLKVARERKLVEAHASATEIVEDRKKPFTTEEWREQTFAVCETDGSIMEGLRKEFNLKNGFVDFQSINEYFFQSWIGLE